MSSAMNDRRITRGVFLRLVAGAALGVPSLLAACSAPAPQATPTAQPPTLAPTAAPKPTAAVPAPTATVATVAKPTAAPASGTIVGGVKLPTYIPAKGPKPDLPSTSPGVDDGYLAFPRGSLYKSVQQAPGKGSEVSVLTLSYYPPFRSEE